MVLQDTYRPLTCPFQMDPIKIAYEKHRSLYIVFCGRIAYFQVLICTVCSPIQKCFKIRGNVTF